MTTHELARKLLEVPDFHVRFKGTIKIWNNEYGEDTSWVDFNDLKIADVGYSDQVVIISGTEIC